MNRRMLIRGLTTAAILMSVAVACAPASTPAPTSDAPLFANGEAVAVVKTWLSQITYDRVVTQRSSRTRLWGDPVAPAVTVTNNCLNLYISNKFDWSSVYTGYGVWVVAASANENRAAWIVYERTKSIDTIQSAFAVC